MALNSMQSTLRKFHAWLEDDQDPVFSQYYSSRREIAEDLFFSNRPGLTPVKDRKEIEDVFAEWYILDFAVNGFVLPDKKRLTFFDMFLKSEKENLTTAEKTFGKNLAKTHMSFYMVKSVEKGMFADIQDVFTKEVFQVWDVALSKNAKKKDIFLGRIVKNEKGKYIGGGTSFASVDPQILVQLYQIIIMTYERSKVEKDSSSLSSFLKWNSYIYIRDVYNPKGFFKTLG